MSNETQKKSDTSKDNKAKKIKVTATEEMRRGVFANNALINHSSEEFRIDFHLITEIVEGKAGTLNARVILTPSHFKRLIKAMNENLKKYEDKFGKVPEKIEPKNKIK